MASSARIDELLKKFEENPRRYFAPLANEYRKAGDVQRAIELCREHLPQQPGHMSGHIVYGQALFEAGEFEEARGVFEEALRLDPENLIALRHLGDIARDRGDVGAARDWYQRVLDADPRNEEIAAQIAGLSSMPELVPDAAAAVEGAYPAGDGATTEPLAPDADLSADIAAGVVDAPSAPASARSEPTSDFLDDALLGATFDGTTTVGAAAAEAPSDYSGNTEIRDVGPSTDEAEDIGLDFDSMESRGGHAAGAGAATSAAAASLEEQPTEEMSLPAMSAADESRFGEIDLSEQRRPDAAKSLDLDSALADDGLAPTPPSGTASVAPTSSTGDELGDLALDDIAASAASEPEPLADEPLADEPLAGATLDARSSAPTEEAPPRRPETATSSEGYSLGRLSGLESMEFTPPEAESAPDHVEDPTFGRTLREDAPASAPTPAAFVTETMAELYLQQGFRDEALGVYRQLLEQNPGDANLRDRVAQLEQGSSSTVSAAAVSSSVIEAAQQRQASPRGARSMRAFLASLASRRAPAGPGGTGEAGSPATASQREAASTAEEAAADAFVEAIGEGADVDATTTPSASASVPRTPTFDEFGFPVVEEGPAPEDDVSASAEPEGAELPESAAIEPATLDYLANEGASAAELEANDAAAAAASAGDAAPPSGPVDSLFDGAAVSRQDEAAASTLADAFGTTPAPQRSPTGDAPRVPTPGRGAAPAPDPRAPATRPAARELSLDDVFRETPRRGSGSVRREGTPSFSFDQFFAEGSSTAPRGGGQARSDATGSGSASATAPGGDAVDGDPTSADIEQFNAWLEGLKKK